jgi:hypothetical protein
VRHKIGVEGVAGSRSSEGVAHAVDVATGQVACGRSADGLTDYPDADWETASFLEKCPVCSGALSGLAP